MSKYLVLLVIAFSWAGELPAQLNLINESQFSLPVPPESRIYYESPIPSTLQLYKRGDDFFLYTNFRKISVYDSSGNLKKVLPLFCFKKKNDRRGYLSPCLGEISLNIVDLGMGIAKFNGISFFDQKGTLRYFAHMKNPQHLSYALHLSNQFNNYYFTVNADDMSEIQTADGISWHLPILPAYWKKSKASRNPIDKVYSYRSSRYEPGLPLGVSFDVDTSYSKVIYSAKDSSLVRCRAIIPARYRFWGYVDSLSVSKYWSGQFNAGASIHPVIALSSRPSRLFFTTSTNPYIIVFDSSATVVGKIFKYGYAPSQFSWFQVEDLGKHCPTSMTLDACVSKISLAVYGLSPIDVQIRVDSDNNLLYRVYSKRLSTQTLDYWLAAFDQGVDTYLKIDSLRARTLQIYDLADGGRFVGEIEVPPLFRILEIDPQGILWAVTGVDETALTVGRFRLVRDGH